MYYMKYATYKNNTTLANKKKLITKHWITNTKLSYMLFDLPPASFPFVRVEADKKISKAFRPLVFKTLLYLNNF